MRASRKIGKKQVTAQKKKKKKTQWLRFPPRPDELWQLCQIFSHCRAVLRRRSHARAVLGPGDCLFSSFLQSQSRVGHSLQTRAGSETQLGV
jgi:hypothetical protein